MSKEPYIQDNKGGMIIFGGAALAFIIAGFFGFTNYEYDFLIGKLFYAACIGMVWALAVGNLLTACNEEYRKNAPVSDKIMTLASVLYPVLFYVGWDFYTDRFLVQHPAIRAYCALFVPALIIFGIRFLVKYFDKNYED